MQTEFARSKQKPPDNRRLSLCRKKNRRSGKYQNLSKVRENIKATGFDISSMST